MLQIVSVAGTLLNAGCASGSELRPARRNRRFCRLNCNWRCAAIADSPAARNQPWAVITGRATSAVFLEFPRKRRHFRIPSRLSGRTMM